MKSLQLRLACTADAEPLHELHTLAVKSSCSSHYSSEQIGGWLSRRSPEGYLDAIQGREIAVATLGGKIVGFNHAKADEVLGLFVAPDHQSQGVGTVLLNDALTRVSSPVRLEATMNAVGFYERNGFRRSGSISVTRGISTLSLERMVEVLGPNEGHTVRRLRTAEVDQFRTIRMAALRDAPDAFGETLAEAERDDWKARALRGATFEDRAVFLAWAGEAPVGMVFVKCGDPSTPAFVGGLWVAPPQRRHRIGRALLREGLRFLREATQTEVELWVTSPNERVIAFYRSFGFVETGVQGTLRPGAAQIIERLSRPLFQSEGRQPAMKLDGR